MNINATIARIEALRRRQAKHVARLAEIETELCPLLSAVLCEHGPTNGVDENVMAAASAPKDDGGK